MLRKTADVYLPVFTENKQREEFSFQMFHLLAMRCRPEKLCWVVVPGWHSGLAAGKVLMFWRSSAFMAFISRDVQGGILRL